MSFCPKCGRQQIDDARYCGGCGTEFAADAAAAAETPLADEPAGEFPQTMEVPATTPAPDVTRMEPQPDVTAFGRPGAAASAAAAPAEAEPDPFASWYTPPPDGNAPPRDEPPRWQWPSAQPRQSADTWQSADTVYAGSTHAAQGFPPPSQPAQAMPPPRPPYGAQPGRPPGGGQSSGGKRVAFIIAAVLVVLAAGGGAYALVSRTGGQNTAQLSANPTGTASASATPTLQASASASASSGTGTATSPSGLVSVGPGLASNPAEPAVETTLTHYFQGINTHDYTEYTSALNAQEQAAQPEAQFNSGFSSTTDSGMTLTSLSSTGNGGLAATVTFISHQSAATSIDGSTCNNWTLTFYLVPQGSGYLKGPAPSSYQPSHSDC